MASGRRPHGFVLALFALDAVLALAPPLHWAVSGAAPVLGVPRSFAYLAAVSALTACTTLLAYALDPGPEGRA